MQTACDKDTPRAVTPAPDDDRWSLNDIEPVLFDLKTDIAILCHLANSNDDIDPETWTLMAVRLNEAQASLATLWRKAWDQRIADEQAAKAALKAAKDQQAAPGSSADIKETRMLWRMLREIGAITIEACEKAAAPRPKTTPETFDR